MNRRDGRSVKVVLPDRRLFRFVKRFEALRRRRWLRARRHSVAAHSLDDVSKHEHRPLRTLVFDSGVGSGVGSWTAGACGGVAGVDGPSLVPAGVVVSSAGKRTFIAVSSAFER